jgi:hypothetical protein
MGIRVRIGYMVFMGDMKTTLEIPDALFREAKAAAARKGQPLRELVTEAIRAKLAEDKALPAEKPWMKHFGALGKTARMRAETDRIQRSIEREFEQFDLEDRG